MPNALPSSPKSEPASEAQGGRAPQTHVRVTMHNVEYSTYMWLVVSGSRVVVARGSSRVDLRTNHEVTNHIPLSVVTACRCARHDATRREVVRVR